MKGLLLFLPIGLTLYLLYFLLATSDNLFEKAVKYFWEDYPHPPGFGAIFTLIVLVVVGRFSQTKFMHDLWSTLERGVMKIPLASSIYRPMKNITDYLDSANGSSKGKAVSVQFPGTKIRMVGFLTRSDVSDLPSPICQPDHVAVYLPMSYQIGGFTIFIPSSQVEEIDMEVNALMEGILIAWVNGHAVKKFSTDKLRG